MTETVTSVQQGHLILKKDNSLKTRVSISLIFTYSRNIAVNRTFRFKVVINQKWVVRELCYRIDL